MGKLPGKACGIVKTRADSGSRQVASLQTLTANYAPATRRPPPAASYSPSALAAAASTRGTLKGFVR